MPDIRHISSLASEIANYDAIISDVWGVLHNGIVATPGAHSALSHARQAGCPVILLTNAPRPPDSITQQLRGFGIPDHAYDAIVSSGGVTRTLLESEQSARFFHLGPDRDIALYEGLDLQKSRFEDAEFILCTGPFDDETETAEDYRTMMMAALERKLRLYCANPDLIVERGDRLLPCAGAIADLYEKLGGDVIWVGKPKPLVYDVARAHIRRILGKDSPARRILCIGDAFRTDIAGAIAHGHESLMTLAGIHGHQIGLKNECFDMPALEALATQTQARPTMCMVNLIW